MLQQILRRIKREEAGFTLVELLIVVAIIAILAAIAIPQFSKYRLRGYKSELDADTKNAYTAAQVYLTDFPAGIVDDAAGRTFTKLKSGGYQPSANVSLVGANMTTGTGALTFMSTSLNSAGKFNLSTVYFNGRFAFVTAP